MTNDFFFDYVPDGGHGGNYPDLGSEVASSGSNVLPRTYLDEYHDIGTSLTILAFRKIDEILLGIELNTPTPFCFIGHQACPK